MSISDGFIETNDCSVEHVILSHPSCVGRKFKYLNSRGVRRGFVILKNKEMRAHVYLEI